MKTILNVMPLNPYFKGKFRKKGFTLKTRSGASEKSPKGFTLIELLIVVAIIAILTGIGATRYQDAVRKGRDAQRKSDLRSVATALEQYYGDRSNYPREDVGEDGDMWCQGPPPPGGGLDWDFDENFACDFGAGTVTYSGDLPSDPNFDSGHPQYHYQGREVDNDRCSAPENTCQRYVLAAVLENTNDPEVVANCLSAAPPLNVYNFCVRNP